MSDFCLCRQYQFGPDPDIMGLFCNFEIHCTDEVGLHTPTHIHII